MVLAGIGSVILLALGISAGPVVLSLAGSAALLALVLYINEHHRLLKGAIRRALALLGIFVVFPVVIGVAFRPDKVEPVLPGIVADEDLIGATTWCKERDCRLLRRLAVGTGREELVLGVVEKFERPQGVEGKFPAGVSVVVLRKDYSVIWRSEFLPGYGFLDLGTDTTQNVFISFAVTNHSTIAWVVGFPDGKAEDYGTSKGRLKVDNFTDPSYEGLRHLYTYRSGWPSNMAKDAIRDVWKWGGQDYRFSGCETADGSRFWEPGATDRTCPTPRGEYSANLPA